MTKIKHGLHRNINASEIMVFLKNTFCWSIMLFLLFTSGCDKAYRYAFFPPERVEYTLVPDLDLVHLSNDTSYSISRDSLGVVYDRKSYKVEVKYLSDYQLNNFEFPDDSKSGEFSANPFTYAEWVDPQVGYTPNRFTVFKISIYNYASSKLNLDPELSFLVSDRGDVLPGYGREEKSSRNQSIEGYYRKRKGSSGVDDEIFERRMGIVRQTVLYLGRPIFQGDSREGIVVYDPLDESVEKIKLVMKNFIIGYDENGEPSEYVDLQFYFKRTPLVKERLKALVPDSAFAANPKQGSSNLIRQESFELHQIRYRVEEEQASTNQDWNVKPNALNALAGFLKDSLNAKTTVKISSVDSPDLLNARIGFIFVGPIKPIFSDVEVLSLANMIRRGGFLFIDNAAFSSNYKYYDDMVALLQNIGSKLDRQVRVIPIPIDHQIYKIWQKLTGPPQGMDDIENMPDKRNFLQGLFWRDQLVGLVSSKGYSMIWDKQDRSQIKQLMLGANVVVYALSTLRPQ
ncbi:MAG: DUF4159 domain-containing protein [Ignavibacteriales bacterium]|nr:DUF4159 domain-containing protein [Ignavibacteriales bacterium]